MSKQVKLTRGYSINLAGKAKPELNTSVQSTLYAIKPVDFLGIDKLKVLAWEGEKVKAGTPLFFSKEDPRIQVTSPVSGEVVELKRGDKRKLLEFRILADKETEYETFDKYSISDIGSLSREDAQEQILKSGVWPHIIQRPYGIVARPDDTPKSIFVSAFDTHPLAADYGMLFKGEKESFQAGINILKKFTKGNIHLGVEQNGEVPTVFANTTGVVINKFKGQHPAGNVGVQIHHIDPIHRDDVVWTVSPYGVIQIGCLFLEGKYDASRIFAVAGSELKKPQYYKGITGMNVAGFLKDNLKQDNVRVVSGNVLTGRAIGKEGFIGFYDNLISVIPEGDNHEFLGWILPQYNKLSFHKAFGLLSFLNGKSKEYVLNSNMNGEERAFVQTGVFEKVTPMDLYPTYLIKAIMANDYDNMEALGIYEVIEEDLALCEFVDVSKHPVQSILREGIEMMRNS